MTDNIAVSVNPVGIAVLPFLCKIPWSENKFFHQKYSCVKYMIVTKTVSKSKDSGFARKKSGQGRQVFIQKGVYYRENKVLTFL